MIQILKEFESRTEYKILKSFEECQSYSINELQAGILVMPGVTLDKLSKEQMSSLYEWTEHYHNQLVLLPAWTEMNLKDIIMISVPIEIKETKSEYEGLPVNYQVRSKTKDVVFENNGKIFGINCRRNTGSGLITVITLPLLDYRLTELEDKIKMLFKGLISHKELPHPTIIVEKVDFYPEELHLYLMLLIGSGVKFQYGYLHHLNKYFQTSLDEETIKLKIDELTSNGYIENNRLKDKGTQFINEKKMKAFIRTIRERELTENGWK